MSTNYGKHIVSSTATPQNQPIPGREAEMVLNAGGGFVFQVDKWTRLDRFLILGAEGGTYYASEKQLVAENAKSAASCLAEDGRRFVERVRDISVQRRAPKNDAAVFLLAMASKRGDLATRELANKVMPDVCRTGTDLFAFARDVAAFGGHGLGTMRAFNRWYSSKTVEQAAFQVAKYGSRHGWSHRDMIRAMHPKTNMKSADYERLQPVLAWVVKGAKEGLSPTGAAKLLWAVEQAKVIKDVGSMVELIKTFKMPWETIPTEWHKDPAVWMALLPSMKPHALIRNLGRLTHLGVLKPLGRAVDLVAERLSKEAVRKAGIHPINVLMQLAYYKHGRAMKGLGHQTDARSRAAAMKAAQHAMTWTPLGPVVDALDSAFYHAFECVEPTNKRHLVALDISGSMGCALSPSSMLTAREVAAAFAMQVCRTEPKYAVVGFSAGGPGMKGWAKPKNLRHVHGGAYPDGITPLSISPKQRLDNVVQYISQLPFGGTDCSLPMMYAEAQDIDVDVFVIITDNETWASEKGHPAQMLRKYRASKGGRQHAKMAVLGVTATECSIADPTDGGMLDFVGFDAAVPALLAEFAGDGKARLVANED